MKRKREKGDLKKFDHQIGGWARKRGRSRPKDMYMYKDRVLKYASPPEILFYKRKVNHYSEIIPEFCGTRNIHGKTYIELLNICYGFSRPNVMDIKVGCRSYDPLASKEKIENEKAKCDLQQSQGFRFTGCKIWESESQRFSVFDRLEARKVTVKDLQALWREFLAKSSVAMQQNLVHELEKILSVVQKSSEWIYAGSLLIVSGNDEKKTAVKLIDFAHVFDKKKYPDDDDGLILGLQNILKSLKLALFH